MTPNDSQLRTVTMGQVRGVHGVRGMLKVESFADPLEQLLAYQPWMLSAQGEGPGKDSVADGATYTVESGQRHGRGLLVKLAECDSREIAQALVGCLIDVAYAQLPVADKDEYYWVDLEGLSVVTTEGVELGTVAYLFDTGANDVIVIRSDGQNDSPNDRPNDSNGEAHRERMVPYISDVVKNVDLDKGTMTVDWDPEF